MNDGHLEGCSRTHRDRQQCDGPVAEAALVAAPPPAAVTVPETPAAPLPHPVAVAGGALIVATTPAPLSYAGSPPAIAYRPARRSPPPPPPPAMNFDYSPLRPAWRDGLAWVAAIIGTIALVVCLAVAGTHIAMLTEERAEPMPAIGVVAIAFVVGAVVGIGLPCVAARAWALVLLAMTSLTLMTGGPLLIVAAFVIRQMESEDVAQDRGFVGLWAFGIVATALGVAIAIWLVSMLRDVALRRAIAGWSNSLGAGYGVLLGSTGALVGFGLLFLIGSDGSADIDGSEISVVENALAVTLVAASLLAPGVILTYHSVSSGMGEGSGPFRARPAYVFAAAFAAVMLAGQFVMMQDSPVAAPMPILHVLAAGLPGLALAAMALRGSPFVGCMTTGLTWRQVTLAAAISMGVASVIAVYVEFIGSYYGIVLLLVHNGAFTDITSFDEFNQIVSDADFLLTDNEQFVAGLIAAALLAPLIEEFAKSLGVRFTMSPWTTRGQAFVLGAYAGAAFGFLEGLSYGLIGISDDLADWWQIMLLRGGSTSLHVLCTGLAGTGWWYWTRVSRHGVAIGLWSIAIAIHAAWNAFFTAIDSRIFVLDTLSNRTIEIIAYSVVVVASLAMIVVIPLVARRLRDAPPPLAEGTPLGAMTPWIA